MQNIIVIEDVERIRLELSQLLKRYGYNVKAPDNFENILDYIKSEYADLILLDINLPIYDGYYICKEIRKNSDIPIIIVTSRDSEVDELMSMNLGADDFVTKPYNPQILLARISAVLKRNFKSTKSEDILNYNGLKLNLYNGSISHNENTIEITKNELKILSYLIKNKGTLVSREELMEYLWSTDYYVDDNSLSVNITRLRKKLSEIGMSNPIQTRRGLGYIME